MMAVNPVSMRLSMPRSDCDRRITWRCWFYHRPVSTADVLVTASVVMGAYMIWGRWSPGGRRLTKATGKDESRMGRPIAAVCGGRMTTHRLSIALRYKWISVNSFEL